MLLTACQAAAPSSKWKIGVVTDVGTVDDKNFNQYSNRARSLGAEDVGAAEPDVVVPKDASEYAADIQSFYRPGLQHYRHRRFQPGRPTRSRPPRPIRTFGSSASTRARASTPTLTRTRRSAAPAIHRQLLPNFVGLQYKEDQAGYLAGIVAASLSANNSVGAIGGINLVPAVVRYIQGYRAWRQVRQPEHHASTPDYVSTSDFGVAFNDPGRARPSPTSSSQTNHPDVLFQVAGKTGNGILESACANGIHGIGVDVDQWLSLAADTTPTYNCIVTSAEKHLSNSVEQTIKQIAAPAWPRSRRHRSTSMRPTTASASRAEHDGKGLITSDIQALLDAALAGMKAGTRDHLPGDLRPAVVASGQSAWSAERAATYGRGPLFLLHRFCSRPGASTHNDEPRPRRRPPQAPAVQPKRARLCGPALEMRGITKRYPGVVANDKIDLDVRPGEIHALLGENGAGKTTLMNVLYGLAVPDDGEILLDGESVHIAGPTDAIARGISMVHQHFMLVPVLSVAENIVLGKETMAASRVSSTAPRRGGRILELAAAVRLRHRSRRQGRPRSRSASNSASRSSRRSTATRASSCSTSRPRCSRPRRRKRSSCSCVGSRTSGRSIIFISHKLYEVLEIADRITVIRRGRVVGERLPKRDHRGRPGRADGRPRSRADGRPRRVASRRGGRSRSADLRVKDDRGHEVVHGVSSQVRAGEILGIAGVAGNGQDELVEAIVGLRPVTSWSGQSRRPTTSPAATPRQHARAGRRLRARRSAPLRADPVLLDPGQPGPQPLHEPAVRARHACATRRRLPGRGERRTSTSSTSGRRRRR